MSGNHALYRVGMTRDFSYIHSKLACTNVQEELLHYCRFGGSGEDKTLKFYVKVFM